ncbi:MAG: undecaprenyl-phosphate glucose phosphotransferase [Ignavibacteria bacterium]|nr:undecaprenyl-phosphate glucose phosphotransferase [Ignavibacteria bacterium]
MPSPRRNDVLIPFLMVAGDFIAIVGSFVLSYFVRFIGPVAALVPVTKGTPPLEAYIVGGLIVAPIWILIFNTRKIYRARRETDFSSEFLQIVRTVSFGMLVVMSLAFFYRDFSYSRLVFFVIWLLAICLVFAFRIAVLRYEKFLYARGRELRHVLLAGSNAVAQQVALLITQRPALGYRLTGYVTDEEERIESVTTQRLGRLADLAAVVDEHRIETVIVCLYAQQKEALNRIMDDLIGRNVQLLLQSDVLGITPARLRVHELFGLPFIGVKDIPMSTWGRIAKRAFDIAFSGAVLILFAPFALLIVILIRLESGRPVFYRQVRVGLEGEEFELYKFRTMVVDAETASGPTWTKKNDPRVTRVGRLLRRLSIDEIPQFLNILKGDMSVVGPRPERPEFVSQFKNYVPKYLERHRLKTGLTGWAQVSGLRGEVPIIERTKYDLYYIENWSLKLDLRIIFKTVRAVLFGKDAY